MCKVSPIYKWPTSRSLLVFFFFSSRRRHTRCSRDWSSDVVLFRSFWATRGALAQNTLKPAPCVLGDWAVPSRVKCRAVQLQDVPEEYLGLDRRLCAPRGGQMLAAHQIRIADRRWLVQMRLPSLLSLLSLL